MAMPKKILLLALLIAQPISSHAADFVDCPGLKGLDVSAILRADRAASCAIQRLKDTDGKVAETLAAADKADGRPVVAMFDKPTSRTAFSVTYKIPEQDLKPGEIAYFAVPPDLSDRPIRFAVLGHRQDPATEKGSKPGEKWDAVPGLTSVQFHAKDEPGNKGWHFWEGQASGNMGAKFAEVRETPEIENLYEFAKYGTGNVSTGEQSTRPLPVDAIRMVSTGKDVVKISEITLKVLPPKPDRYIEHSFSNGTKFGDPETLHGETLGGGQAFEGTFPGALALKPFGQMPNPPALPPGWYLEKGQLHIPLPKGASMTGLELAIGDSHDDKKTNSDGGYGKQGWAKANAYLQKANGQRDTILDRENVPPEGVLVGTAADGCYQAQEGDEIVIDSKSDTSYLMGLRIWLNDPI